MEGLRDSSEVIPLPADTSYLQTLAAGLQVLDILRRQPFLTLTKIGECMGGNTSKVYRLLNTLEAERYVAKTPGKTYYLGPAAIALGFSAHRQFPLVVQARDVLDWLVEETRESSYLVIRNGRSRVVLDMRDAPQRLRSFAPVGEDHPLHVSGAGLTLLAFSEGAFIDEILAGDLLSITAATETDPKRLRDVLRLIRQRGYHVSKDDFKSGAFSIGAPIFNRAGVLEAAVAVAGPASSLNSAKEAKITDRVTEAAVELSVRLGYRPSGDR
jgi:IclR family KDG regulon transcriptional repressor